MEAITAKKWLGQHFLGNEETAARISELIPKNKTVLEIGPGLGIFTTPLAARCKKLTAIELDPDLVKILKKKFKAFKNVEIVHGDCMNENFSNYDVVCGLLPYNISSQIIEKFCKSESCKTAIFVIQKELAQRVVASPGTREYSRFSILCQNNANCEVVEFYPPEAFWPAPQVHSGLVKMEKKKPLLLDQAVVNALFQHKNQKLKKALKHSAHLLGKKVDAILEKNRELENKKVVELSLEEIGRLK